MPTELVELQDGILVEIQSDPREEAKQCCAVEAQRVEGAMAAAKDLLLKAVQPVVSVWSELNRDLAVDQVVIELGLGFEGSGKLFIVQGTGKANVSFKLTMRAKPDR